MDRFETKEFLRLIQLTHPRFKVDKDVMGIWYGCFFEKPFEVMKQALKRHLLRCKFSPSVSEISDILIEMEPKQMIPQQQTTPEQRSRASSDLWRQRRALLEEGLIILREVTNGKATYRFVRYTEDNSLWILAGHDVQNGERLPYLVPAAYN